MLVTAYVRVSTDEQKLGPEAQRTAIEAWTAAQGACVATWHADIGVSGATPPDERPGLLGAIATLRKGSLLVVAKRDRLARDVWVAATIERLVAARGAQLVSADGAGNGDSPADAFMRTILDGAAAYERALIRARTKAALAELRASGKRLGTVPFGYQAGPGGELIPEPREALVVQTVRELAALGVSQRGIAARLAAAGLHSRAGKPLSQVQVMRILHASAKRAP